MPAPQPKRAAADSARLFRFSNKQQILARNAEGGINCAWSTLPHDNLDRARPRPGAGRRYRFIHGDRAPAVPDRPDHDARAPTGKGRIAPHKLVARSVAGRDDRHGGIRLDCHVDCPVRPTPTNPLVLDISHERKQRCLPGSRSVCASTPESSVRRLYA